MPRFIVRPGDVAFYAPGNHSGTVNQRLIGPATVGATRLEVVLGIIQPQHGASAHAHPDMEQVCYVLEGQLVVTVDGVQQEIGRGDCCFFAAGVEHTVTAIGDAPARLLLIYSPPYGEDPARVLHRAV